MGPGEAPIVPRQMEQADRLNTHTHTHSEREKEKKLFNKPAALAVSPWYRGHTVPQGPTVLCLASFYPKRLEFISAVYSELKFTFLKFISKCLHAMSLPRGDVLKLQLV